MSATDQAKAAEIVARLERAVTCSACPEIWDISLDGTYIAYMRLRWGGMSVCIDYAGFDDEVFSREWDDPFLGSIPSESKDYWEEKIFDAVARWFSARPSLFRALAQGE